MIEQPTKFADLSWNELNEQLKSLKGTGTSPFDHHQLLQELQMHQIELEMQRRELRDAHQRLESARARYTELYDQAPVGYVSLDTGGVIVDANLTAVALFGHPRSMLIGTPFAAAAQLTDLRAFRAHLRECEAATQKIVAELERTAPDGTVVVLQVTTRREVSHNGETSGYRLTMTDVTEARVARADKAELANERRARREADEANRMKDQFLGIVSHELRTPLNAMLGWTQIIESRADDVAIVRRANEVMQRNARTLARIVDDILDVSRIVSGKLLVDLTKADFADVVRAALDIARPAAVAKDVELRQSIRGECLLRGDATRLEQVVTNLLSNSLKFTRRGGHISVTLERMDQTIRLTVSDDGCGIEARDLPHIFESFRQADSSTTRPHSGLGLGLAIAQHIVVAHGGSIAARSDGAGMGTTVTVELPPARFSTPPPPRFAPRPGATDPPPSLEGMRVLFVDDEPAARELAELTLADLGAIVATADSVSRALQRMATFIPHVVVSDVAMPERDGYDLMRAVRKLPPPLGGVPAIALTAYARAEDASQAIEAGFTHHLPKPIGPDTLAGLLRTAIRKP
jgi:PAS domain S-box-containing protein